MVEENTKIITLEDRENISVEIKRKRIKNMYLRVKAGGCVAVSAPFAFTDETILNFVVKHSDWIAKHLEKSESRPPENVYNYVSGETFLYKGKSYTLKAVTDKTKYLAIGDKEILVTFPIGTSRENKEAFFKKQMKIRLIRYLKERIFFWEEIMKLHSSSFQVREMKSRWGSCNIRTGKLCFNLHLIKADPVCIDYVIIHELSHLVYAGHGADFWGLVMRYMPDYKRIRKKLNEIHIG